jgi:hypothetical protein
MFYFLFIVCISYTYISMYQILSNLSRKYGIDCAFKVCKRYLHLLMLFGPIIAKQGLGSFADVDLVFQSGYSMIEPFELNSEGICTSLCSGLPLIVEDGGGGWGVIGIQGQSDGGRGRVSVRQGRRVVSEGWLCVYGATIWMREDGGETDRIIFMMIKKLASRHITCGG